MYFQILRIDEKVSQYEQDIHYDSVVYLGSGVSGQCYLMKDRESQQKFCIKIVSNTNTQVSGKILLCIKD